MWSILACCFKIVLPCGASTSAELGLKLRKAYIKAKTLQCASKKKSVGCDQVLDLSFLLESCSCVSSIAFSEGHSAKSNREFWSLKVNVLGGPQKPLEGHGSAYKPLNYAKFRNPKYRAEVQRAAQH